MRGVVYRSRVVMPFPLPGPVRGRAPCRNLGVLRGSDMTGCGKALLLSTHPQAEAVEQPSLVVSCQLQRFRLWYTVSS